MAQILKITNEFSFFASHRLDCIGEEAHSHDYKFQVSVTGSLDKNDMVIDFLKLQKIVQEVIIASLENKLLNDIIPNPTAENVTLWIWDQLQEKLNLQEIRFWETPIFSVTYNGDR